MRLALLFLFSLLGSSLGRAAALTAEAVIQDGFARQAKGDLAGAKADFDQAIQLNPDFAPAYNDRGDIELRTADVPGAIADFSQAVQLDPGYAMAWRNRGVAHERNGDFSAAAEDFDRAIALKPDDPAGYLNRGVLKKKAGDFAGSVLDDNRAIALKPRYEIAYMDRGEARVAQGDIAGGLQDYQQAMAIGPALPMIQYRIGAARQAQGDLAGAIAEYDAALKVAFKYPDAYAGRGVAKAARGDLTGALADLRQAQTLAHQRADRTPSLIWLLRVQLNQKAEADQDLTTFLATLPSGWDSKIGEMLIGEIDEDQLLAASAAVQPATARLQQKEAWYYIGMKRLLAGDKPAAASDFQKCVALGDPIEPEDTLARAELVTLGGKPNP